MFQKVLEHIVSPIHSLKCGVKYALLLCVISTVSSAQLEKVSGYPTYQPNDMSFSSARTGIVINGNSTISTRDSGVSWQMYRVDSLHPRAGQLYSVVVDSSGYGWCVGEKIAIHTFDYGATWKRVGYKSPDTIALELSKANLYDVCDLGDSLVWIAGGMYHLLFSSDRGTTWSRIPCYDSSDGVAQSVQFVSKMHGWVLRRRNLIETTDGGQNWTKIGTRSGFSEVQMVNDTLGWGFTSSDIVKTNDGGHTWKAMFRSGRECDLVFSHFGENRVWCATGPALCIEKMYIYSSFDGGKTWDSISVPRRTAGFDQIFAADSSTLYVWSYPDLFRITNGGRPDTTTSVVDEGGDVQGSYFYLDKQSERFVFAGRQVIDHVFVSNVISDILFVDSGPGIETPRTIDATAFPNGMYYVHYRIGEHWHTSGVVVVR